MKIARLLTLAILSLSIVSCGDDDDIDLSLTIPTEYLSPSYEDNVTAERAVVTELSTLSTEINAAEAVAQTTTVSAIAYPATLSSVTLPTYSSSIETWLGEIVKAANAATAFVNPGDGTPDAGEEGGLLGGRLLDENGLELEQMVEKGSFGAALYNHALTVIDGDLTDASIDQLVEIFGTDAAFVADEASFAAKYAKRRSFNATGEGYFYDIKLNLITAKAAIAAGDAFASQRDDALEAFKLNWEKSNYATVIYYCNSAKVKLQEANGDDDNLGSALHSYAEGVGFANGFRGISDKKITDAQIDSILELLLAPAGDTPESYKFLNDATLIANLTQIIEDIQAIYGFTDLEVASFLEDDPA